MDVRIDQLNNYIVETYGNCQVSTGFTTTLTGSDSSFIVPSGSNPVVESVPANARLLSSSQEWRELEFISLLTSESAANGDEPTLLDLGEFETAYSASLGL